MSFEEAKQILQMEDNGSTLYDHLANVSDFRWRFGLSGLSPPPPGS